MDASLNTQDQKEWMTGRYSLDESLILLCVIVLLSVKASQNNLAYRRKLVSIVGKWSLLPPTIGVNSHSQTKNDTRRRVFCKQGGDSSNAVPPNHTDLSVFCTDFKTKILRLNTKMSIIGA